MPPRRPLFFMTRFTEAEAKALLVWVQLSEAATAARALDECLAHPRTERKA